MFSIVNVPLDERVFVHVDRVPTRVLGPGRHWVWTWRPLHVVQLVRVSTDLIVAKLKAEEVALVPPGDLRVVRLAPHERAVVSVRGKPTRWLGAGEHAVWMVEKTVTHAATGARVMPAVGIELIDTSGVAADPLQGDVRALAPATDYVEVTVPQGAVTITGEVRGKATSLGLEVSSLALKDVVLPGEMKTLLNRVIEALAEIASKVGHVNVVLGDGALPVLKLPGVA